MLTTKKTVEMKLEDLYLPDYPLVFPDYPAEESIFQDTVVPNNSYLAALGGDYDGCW